MRSAAFADAGAGQGDDRLEFIGRRDADHPRLPAVGAGPDRRDIAALAERVVERVGEMAFPHRLILAVADGAHADARFLELLLDPAELVGDGERRRAPGSGCTRRIGSSVFSVIGCRRRLRRGGWCGRTGTGSTGAVLAAAWRPSAALARMMRIMLFCGACALPERASRWWRSSGLSRLMPGLPPRSSASVVAAMAFSMTTCLTAAASGPKGRPLSIILGDRAQEAAIGGEPDLDLPQAILNAGQCRQRRAKAGRRAGGGEIDQPVAGAARRAIIDGWNEREIPGALPFVALEAFGGRGDVEYVLERDRHVLEDEVVAVGGAHAGGVPGLFDPEPALSVGTRNEPRRGSGSSVTASTDTHLRRGMPVA